MEEGKQEGRRGGREGGREKVRGKDPLSIPLFIYTSHACPFWSLLIKNWSLLLTTGAAWLIYPRDLQVGELLLGAAQTHALSGFTICPSSLSLFTILSSQPHPTPIPSEVASPPTRLLAQASEFGLHSIL